MKIQFTSVRRWRRTLKRRINLNINSIETSQAPGYRNVLTIFLLRSVLRSNLKSHDICLYCIDIDDEWKWNWLCFTLHCMYGKTSTRQINVFKCFQQYEKLLFKKKIFDFCICIWINYHSTLTDLLNFSICYHIRASSASYENIY